MWGPEKVPRRGARGATTAGLRRGPGLAVARGPGRSGGDERRQEEERGVGGSVRSVGADSSVKPPTPPVPPPPRALQGEEGSPQSAGAEGRKSKRVYSTSSWLRGPAMETSTLRRRTLSRAHSAVL